MEEKPVRGYRANCIFHDEIVWDLVGDFDELVAGFMKVEPKPFSEEIKIISAPKEFKVKNDT